MCARLLLAVAVLCACACAAPRPPPSRVELPGPGRTHPPYRGVPAYLEPEPPAPLGPAGRWDERVPVASRGATPRPVEDGLRLLLAELDVVAVGLRGQPPPRAVEPLRRVADALALHGEEYANFVAYARQLDEIAARLVAAPPRETAGLIDRIFEIADLIRLQLRAS